MLTYNVPEESLQGNIGAALIKCQAGSGGFAGTKRPDTEQFFFKNNVFASAVAGRGPIPLGTYYMHPHETKNNIVRLVPDKSNLMFGRSGFLIHGRGPIGSEGCIVPYHFTDVVNIYKQVEKYLATNSGRRPTLKVIAVSGNVDWKQRIA